MKAFLNKIRYLLIEIREPLTKGDAILVAFIGTAIFGLLLLLVMMQFYWENGTLTNLEQLREGVTRWE